MSHNAVINENILRSHLPRKLYDDISTFVTTETSETTQTTETTETIEQTEENILRSHIPRKLYDVIETFLTSEATEQEFKLSEHYERAYEDLKQVRILVDDRQVTEIKMISATCATAWPCKGHDGIDIILDTGDNINYNCLSVSIGAIMVYYASLNVKTDNHCNKYIDQEFKAMILRSSA